MAATKDRPFISTPEAVRVEATGHQGRTQILGLAVVLLVAAVLRLWRLEQNGFDNEYYAAAVLSMTQSWHNFFYNAFDPAGFVSVDKPLRWPYGFRSPASNCSVLTAEVSFCPRCWKVWGRWPWSAISSGAGSV